jgi:hypothetical protein
VDCLPTRLELCAANERSIAIHQCRRDYSTAHNDADVVPLFPLCLALNAFTALVMGVTSLTERCLNISRPSLCTPYHRRVAPSGWFVAQNVVQTIRT